MSWVRDTAIVDRAYLGTARRLKPANALGAFIGVDHIDRLGLANSLVLAFGLASATADALLGNLIGHLSYLLRIDILRKLSPFFAYHLLLPLFSYYSICSTTRKLAS